MSDTICRYGSSTYQHGPLNNRIYLMRVTSKEIPEIFNIIEELALTSKYAKIVAKVPVSLSGDFLQRKYQKEALIPRFFHGKEDCVFMSRFLSYRNGQRPIHYHSMYAIPRKGHGISRTPVLPEGYRSQPCKESDVHALSALFSRVYETYPFPINNPDFLLAMMRDGTRYHGIWFGDTIVAASSAEVDANEMNAEMTDFLVHHLQDLKREFRARTYVHARYEITNAEGLPHLKRLIRQGLIHLFSLMDHTPGQGQFSDVAHFRAYYAKARGLSAEHVDRLIARRLDASRRIDWPGLELLAGLCRENGIRHLLTAPRSPTTTGKVERFHKTVRLEFLRDRVFVSIAQAQHALDEWVERYNTRRPHQGIGMASPLDRFVLAVG